MLSKALIEDLKGKEILVDGEFMAQYAKPEHATEYYCFLQFSEENIKLLYSKYVVPIYRHKAGLKNGEEPVIEQKLSYSNTTEEFLLACALQTRKYVQDNSAVDRTRQKRYIGIASWVGGEDGSDGFWIDAKSVDEAAQKALEVKENQERSFFEVNKVAEWPENAVGVIVNGMDVEEVTLTFIDDLYAFEMAFEDDYSDEEIGYFEMALRIDDPELCTTEDLCEECDDEDDYDY